MITTKKIFNLIVVAVLSLSGLHAQVQITATGTANAILITHPSNITTLTPGLEFTFRAFANNTGPVTLNVNSLGVIDIKKEVTEDLVADEIRAGQMVTVIYDGGNFQMTTISGKTVATTASELEDADTIRFSVAGSEEMTLTTGGRINMPNNGRSIFLGERAGENDDLINNDNVFIGYEAGKDISSATRNVAIGNYSLNSSTTTGNNVAVGYGTLTNATSGSNVAVGFDALNATSTGGNNTALGNISLQANTTGDRNTAIGSQALFTNDDGQRNTAAGFSALENNVSGTDNTAIGIEALHNTTGSFNTAVGLRAGETNTLGSNNTFIGTDADATSNNLTNATAIGANAEVVTSNSLILGDTTNVNVGIGTGAPQERFHLAAGKLRITDLAGPTGGVALIDTDGNIDTVRLTSALQVLRGDGTFGDLTGDGNGIYSGSGLLSGTTNIDLLMDTLNVNLTSGTAGAFAVNNTGNPALIVDFNGNVGIGLNTPSARLEVDGGIVSDSLMTDLLAVNDLLFADSIEVDSLFISGGTPGDVLIQSSTGSVVWTSIGGDSEIADADDDTRIEVEDDPTADTIRFEIDGNEEFRFLANGRIIPTRTGHSVFMGGGAGVNDDLSDNRNVFIGDDAGINSLSGENNVALGSLAGSTLTTGAGNVFLGSQANTTKSDITNSIGIGLLAEPSQDGSISIGANSRATAVDAIALGTNAQTNADSAIAIGAGTIAFQVGSIVLGDGGSSNFDVGINTASPQGQLHIVGTTISEGDIIFANGTSRFFGVDDNNTGAGDSLFVVAGNSTTAGENGGALVLSGGDGGGGGSFGGDLILRGGGGDSGDGEINSLSDMNILEEQSLKFFDSDNSNFTGIKAPNNMKVDVTWVLPDTLGAIGEVLSSDGTGFLDWIPAGGGDFIIDGNNNHLSNVPASISGTDNVIIGDNAGSALTTAISTVLIGRDAGSSMIATGTNFSVAIGAEAARDISAASITAIGHRAGMSTTGAGNTFIGSFAADANTSGSQNTAIGGLTDMSITNLQSTVLIGFQAIAGGDAAISIGRSAQANADSAIAIGAGAIATNPNTIILGDVTNANYKVGIGLDNPDEVLAVNGNIRTDSVFIFSGSAVTPGDVLTAIDANGKAYWAPAGGDFIIDGNDNHLSHIPPALTTGSGNIGIGQNAINNLTEGTANVAIGQDAGTNLSTANNTVLIGQQAGELIQTATGTVAIGGLAGNQNVSGADNVFVGNRAGQKTTAGPNVFVGSFSGGDNETGNNNVSFGISAMRSNVTGNFGTAIGAEAMQFANNTPTAFNNRNVAVGYRAIKGSPTASANTGNANTAVGYQTLKLNTTGSSNVAIGTEVLGLNTTGGFNVANGANAMLLNTTGVSNTALGYSALTSNVAGSNATAVGAGAMENVNNSATFFTNSNVAVGYQALRGSLTPANNTGNNNTVIGYEALRNYTTGGGNVANGYFALRNNDTGSDNVASGYRALDANTSGAGNVAMGNLAGAANTIGSDNTFIGNGANASANNLTNATAIGANTVVGASNSLVLGTNVNVGIGISVPTERLEVNGNTLLGGNLVVDTKTTTDSLIVNTTFVTPPTLGATTATATIGPFDKRVVKLNGATTVNEIDGTSAEDGQELILLKVGGGSITFIHDFGGTYPIMLTGAVNLTGFTQGSTLTLMFFKDPFTDAKDRWIEIARSIK